MVRDQVEGCTVGSKIVLLFEERCLDKRRSFRNDLPDTVRTAIIEDLVSGAYERVAAEATAGDPDLDEH